MSPKMPPDCQWPCWLCLWVVLCMPTKQASPRRSKVSSCLWVLCHGSKYGSILSQHWGGQVHLLKRKSGGHLTSLIPHLQMLQASRYSTTIHEWTEGSPLEAVLWGHALLFSVVKSGRQDKIRLILGNNSCAIKNCMIQHTNHPQELLCCARYCRIPCAEIGLKITNTRQMRYSATLANPLYPTFNPTTVQGYHRRNCLTLT